MVVLILEGAYWQTDNVIVCLKKEKVKQLHVISRLAEKSFLQLYPGVGYHFFRGANDEAYLRHIQSVIKKVKATVLLSVSETDNRFVITHQDQLKQWIHLMPLPQLSMFETARNKKLLANFMQQHGSPLPQTVDNFAGNIDTIAETFPFPALLKPVIGHAGHGIIEFKNANQFSTYAKANPIVDKNYILQEFIEGYNLSCYVLYSRGELICCTMQKALVPGRTPFQVSMGMEFIYDDGVKVMVHKLMQQLEWNGYANIDLRFNEKTGKTLILEINPRFSFTIQASMKTTGINFPYLLCRLAKGEKITKPIPRTGRYIPFFVLVKNKLKGSMHGHKFSWRDVDVANSLHSLLPRIVMRLWGKNISRQ